MANTLSNTRDINLETRLGNRIENIQVLGLPKSSRKRFELLAKEWQKKVTIRRGPTGTFNCHGLVFASRRTFVEDSGEVQKILNEDGYQRVSPERVNEGDIIVYIQDGDYEHSGMVVGVGPDRYVGNLLVPLVVSKWGNFWEVIHSANTCPYNFVDVQYYRQQKHMPGETSHE